MAENKNNRDDRNKCLGNVEKEIENTCIEKLQ